MHITDLMIKRLVEGVIGLFFTITGAYLSARINKSVNSQPALTTTAK